MFSARWWGLFWHLVWDRRNINRPTMSPWRAFWAATEILRIAHVENDKRADKVSLAWTRSV